MTSLLNSTIVDGHAVMTSLTDNMGKLFLNSGNTPWVEGQINASIDADRSSSSCLFAVSITEMIGNKPIGMCKDGEFSSCCDVTSGQTLSRQYASRPAQVTDKISRRNSFNGLSQNSLKLDEISSAPIGLAGSPMAGLGRKSEECERCIEVVASPNTPPQSSNLVINPPSLTLESTITRPATNGEVIEARAPVWNLSRMPLNQNIPSQNRSVTGVGKMLDCDSTCAAGGAENDMDVNHVDASKEGIDTKSNCDFGQQLADVVKSADDVPDSLADPPDVLLKYQTFPVQQFLQLQQRQMLQQQQLTLLASAERVEREKFHAHEAGDLGLKRTGSFESVGEGVARHDPQALRSANCHDTGDGHFPAASPNGFEPPTGGPFGSSKIAGVTPLGAMGGGPLTSPLFNVDGQVTNSFTFHGSSITGEDGTVPFYANILSNSHLMRHQLPELSPLSPLSLPSPHPNSTHFHFFGGPIPEVAGGQSGAMVPGRAITGAGIIPQSSASDAANCVGISESLATSQQSAMYFPPQMVAGPPPTSSATGTAFPPGSTPQTVAMAAMRMISPLQVPPPFLDGSSSLANHNTGITPHISPGGYNAMMRPPFVSPPSLAPQAIHHGDDNSGVPASAVGRAFPANQMSPTCLPTSFSQNAGSVNNFSTSVEQHLRRVCGGVIDRNHPAFLANANLHMQQQQQQMQIQQQHQQVFPQYSPVLNGLSSPVSSANVDEANLVGGYSTNEQHCGTGESTAQYSPQGGCLSNDINASSETVPILNGGYLGNGCGGGDRNYGNMSDQQQELNIVQHQHLLQKQWRQQQHQQILQHLQQQQQYGLLPNSLQQQCNIQPQFTGSQANNFQHVGTSVGTNLPAGLAGAGLDSQTVMGGLTRYGPMAIQDRLSSVINPLSNLCLSGLSPSEKQHNPGGNSRNAMFHVSPHAGMIDGQPSMVGCGTHLSPQLLSAASLIGAGDMTTNGVGAGGERFSRKVFVGGLPPDIDEEEITLSFSQYGALSVDWPHKAESKSYFPPKGYAFLIFQQEISVQALIGSCFAEGDKLFVLLSSPTIKQKPVQIRPWRIADSDYVLNASLTLDPRKTVFVGGVPRPLKASELAMILDKLYGGVCYAGIDTDPELRYPKGAGRVAFADQRSYIQAITARFVDLKHGEINKRVEVKPYVLDDQLCDECTGARCGGKYAPFFCASVQCLQYYCEFCWTQIHSEKGREFHKPLVKEGSDRPRALPAFRWM